MVVKSIQSIGQHLRYHRGRAVALCCGLRAKIRRGPDHRRAESLKVRFLDGETIVGYTMGYSPDRMGFFLVPADSKGNNERIFVVKSATEKVEMMQA